MKLNYCYPLCLGALLLCGAPNLFAGSIIITGHDTDDHGATSFMNWGLTALLTGNGANVPASPTAKIGYIGNDSPNLGSYLGNYNNFEFYDLDNPGWTSAFTDNNSVLVIGSGSDFVEQSGSTQLNSQLTAFISYFNAGGNLLVNTEQGLGQSFYGFIPSFGATLSSSLPGCSSESGSGACMNVTAAGAARGHTIGHIVDADITHTRFTNVNPAFQVLSIYNNSGSTGTGSAITIGLFDGTAGEGGFNPPTGVPEPSTTALLGAGVAALAWMRYKRMSI